MNKKNLQFNPVAPRRVALLFEPIVISGFLLYVYLFYLFIKFYKFKFDFYELAYNSLFVELFGYREKSRHLMLSMFMTQLTVTTSAAVLFIGGYVSAGNTLPKSILEETNMDGKVALVTGGYSGIGYETVLQLLKWKCKVVIFGRNKTRATNAIERMKATGFFNPDNVSFIEIDLDDLLSVKNAATKFLSKFDRLDFLVNNAGIWVRGLAKTHNNIEAQFSSNFLGHFYLTKLLLDVVKKSNGRIINVSSVAHYKYDPATDGIFNNKSTTSLAVKTYNTYYGRSKLFVLWFNHCLQRRLSVENDKVLCLCAHPGVINTKLLWPLSQSAHFYLVPKYLNLLIVKGPVQGASTTLYLCAAPAHKLVSGGYYSDRRLAFVSKHAHNYELEEKLWELAEEMVEKHSK